MQRANNKKLYIDALALIPDKKSGVGQTLENTLKELTPLLLSEGWEIKLAVPLGKSQSLKRYTGTAGVSIKTIPLPARLLSLMSRLNLLPIDWLIGQGVYLFPNYRNWPLWSSRAVTYIYDLGFKLYPDTVQPKNLRYLAKYIPKWVARSEKIIAITQNAKKEIVEHLNVPPERVDIVYCGVDTELFHHRSLAEIKKVKQKYSISYDKYILFVGNIEPRKNLVRLLEAYAALPETLRNQYGLVIIGGDGWLNDSFYDKLNVLRAQGAHVMKVGKYVKTEDLPAVYSGARALVQPAVYEGFGITVLEALATKSSVAVSDIPMIREVAEDAAAYFNPFEVESIADVLTRLLKNPSADKSIVCSGLKRVEYFSWQNSALALHDSIVSLWAEGRRPHTIRGVSISAIQKTQRAAILLDRKIRGLLGDKSLNNYVPEPANSLNGLRHIVMADFQSEQPALMQACLLDLYLNIKHLAANIVQILVRATGLMR